MSKFPLALLFGLLASGVSTTALAASGTLFKNPQCGCCTAWADKVARTGVSFTTRETTELATIRTRQQVPANLGSCHTAVIDGYTFEGHVPPDLVAKVLKEKPAIAGLAVPGMPPGSAGMEGNGPAARYTVYAFDKAGRYRVYAPR